MIASQNYELTGRALASPDATPDSTDTPAHAIAKHLNEKYGGTRTVLRLLVHRLLWPQDVQQGKPLRAEDTYVPVGEITYPPSAAAAQLGARRRGDVVSIAREARR
jgi:hypothetical protein